MLKSEKLFHANKKSGIIFVYIYFLVHPKGKIDVKRYLHTILKV